MVVVVQLVYQKALSLISPIISLVPPLSPPPISLDSWSGVTRHHRSGSRPTAGKGTVEAPHTGAAAARARKSAKRYMCLCVCVCVWVALKYASSRRSSFGTFFLAAGFVIFYDKSFGGMVKEGVGMWTGGVGGDIRGCGGGAGDLLGFMAVE